MRIENSNSRAYQVGHVAERGTKEAGRRASASGSSTEVADSVSLSPRSRQLLLLRQRLEETPDVREELVADLRGQVQAGTYNPSARLVAQRIHAEIGHLLRE